MTRQGTLHGCSSTGTLRLSSYNQVAYLDGAIASVLTQTLDSLELIIVDNGSTDGSHELLRKYTADPRIRLMLHDRNEAVTRRLNGAIASATGDFVSILYADDYYLPDKLARQLAAFDSLPLDYGVVYSPCYREDARTGERWTDPTLKRSGSVLKDMFALHFSEGFINPISTLIRRDCFARCPFHEDVFVEGESIFLRLAVTYKFWYVDEPLAVMREHATNMGKAIKKNTAVAVDLLDRLPQEPGFPAGLLPDLRAFRATLLGNCGWLGIRMAEDPEWARACVMAAYRTRRTQLLGPRAAAALALSACPVSMIRVFNRMMTRIRRNKETVAFKEDYR